MKAWKWGLSHARRLREGVIVGLINIKIDSVHSPNTDVDADVHPYKNDRVRVSFVYEG